jgi:hypothetical protein
MEYAYKYGVLLGSIKMAIIELSTTKSIKPWNSETQKNLQTKN